MIRIYYGWDHYITDAAIIVDPFRFFEIDQSQRSMLMVRVTHSAGLWSAGLDRRIMLGCFLVLMNDAIWCVRSVLTTLLKHNQQRTERANWNK